jgi:Glycosyltransferase sugar-binding region containing DXD motif
VELLRGRFTVSVVHTRYLLLFGLLLLGVSLLWLSVGMLADDTHLSAPTSTRTDEGEVQPASPVHFHAARMHIPFSGAEVCENSAAQRFHMVWATDSAHFSHRELASLESVIYHHPHAQVHLYSNSLAALLRDGAGNGAEEERTPHTGAGDDASEAAAAAGAEGAEGADGHRRAWLTAGALRACLLRFREGGFALKVHSYDESTLHRLLLEVWRLDPARRDQVSPPYQRAFGWVAKRPVLRHLSPFYHVHEADFLRTLLLVRYGGSYTDLDAVFVRPTSHYRNAVGTDWAGGAPLSCTWCLDPTTGRYLAPGVMLNWAPMHPVLLRVLDDTFDSDTYSPDCFQCYGALPLNIAYMRWQAQLSRPPPPTSLYDRRAARRLRAARCALRPHDSTSGQQQQQQAEAEVPEEEEGGPASGRAPASDEERSAEEELACLRDGDAVVAGASDDVHLLAEQLLYPVRWDQAVEYSGQMPGARELWGHVRSLAVSVHLYGHALKDVEIHRHSVLGRALQEFRLFREGSSRHAAQPDSFFFEVDGPATVMPCLDPELNLVEGVRVVANPTHLATLQQAGALRVRVTAQHDALLFADSGAHSLPSDTIERTGTLLEINRALSLLVYSHRPDLEPTDHQVGQDYLTVDVSTTSARPSVRVRRVLELYELNRLVTVVGTTSGRLHLLDRMVDSLRAHYPSLPVLLSNDGLDNRALPQYGMHDPHTAMVLAPFDGGVPFMRNHLVQRARTPYVLVVDDEVVFDLGANLGALLRNLISAQYNVVAGQDPPPLVQQQQQQRYGQPQRQQNVGLSQGELSGLMQVERHTLHLERGDYGTDGDCRIVDFVPDVFMGDRATLLQLRWDERLKLGGRPDFFWRAKLASLKVGSCNGVWLTRALEPLPPLSW